MSERLLVINAVGLSAKLLRDHADEWLRDYKWVPLAPEFPAVTCTVQSSILTGSTPDRHGIVGNGWYDRGLCEVQFWKQANRLVQGEKIWDKLRSKRQGFTCANMFWWYNMYSSVDFSCTPRPCYPADGRKLPDIYTHPPELKENFGKDLGNFPLFRFWGPGTNLESSAWIAAATRHIMCNKSPNLVLSYLPHMDYVLQREGPEGPHVGRDLMDLLGCIDQLMATAKQQNYRVLILSEYAIEKVHRDIQLNRVFRKMGWLKVRDELGLEILDPGASQAFAVCDHQVAHIYINDTSITSNVRKVLEETPGISGIFAEGTKKDVFMDHPRSGDIVVEAAVGHWFSYYYWLDDRKAPDFSRTVDIHRKPGYDPAELVLDPEILFPRWAIAKHIFRQKLGMRSLLKVIPLKALSVLGSHGRRIPAGEQGPLLLSRDIELKSVQDCRDVHDLILRHFLA